MQKVSGQAFAGRFWLADGRSKKLAFVSDRSKQDEARELGSM
jgi:hypothetical protein